MMKKLLLTLGTVSAIVAPIAAVVSCGTSTEYSKVDQDIIGKVTATEASRAVEGDWLIKVLKEVYKTTDKTISEDNLSDGDFKNDFIKTTRFYLATQLKNDPTFLTKIYSSIVALGNVDIVSAAAGFDSQIFDKTKVNDAVSAANISDADLVKVLYDITKDTNGDEFNPIVLNVKNTIMKELITQKYLNLSKGEWASVFKTEDAQLPDYISGTTLTSTESFPLVKKAMEQKLAAKWEVKLDETDSTQFVSFTDVSASRTIDSLMKLIATDAADTTKVIDHLTWSEKTATLTQPIFTKNELLGTQIDKIIGYAGTASLPSGESGLLFSKNGIKAQGDAADKGRTGVLEDKKIISEATAPVKYIQKDQKIFDVTLFKSLMPIYDKTKSTLTFDGTDVKVDELKLMLATTDSTLYQDALKYYTTDVEENTTTGVKAKPAIQIEVNNEEISKLWIDKGLSYVKYVKDANKN